MDMNMAGRRKRGAHGKKSKMPPMSMKMMDAYGGKDMTMEEMTEKAKSMAPKKPSISDTARKRRKALMARVK